MPCPICEKRKPARFCPAKGESICAVCCGSGREVTIDCLPDCTYLLAAHRYEDEHRPSLSPDLPFMDVDVRPDLHQIHAQFIAQTLHVTAKFCAAQSLITDQDALMAVQSLAKTYRTLSSGLYYEQLPSGRLALELYQTLAAALDEIKGNSAPLRGQTPPRDSEIFQLLVILYRYGLLRSNGRPRSRRFIEFIRSEFPDSQELKRTESRIIVP